MWIPVQGRTGVHRLTASLVRPLCVVYRFRGSIHRKADEIRIKADEGDTGSTPQATFASVLIGQGEGSWFVIGSGGSLTSARPARARSCGEKLSALAVNTPDRPSIQRSTPTNSSFPEEVHATT